MFDLTEMSAAEVRQLREVADAWAAYGPALRTKAQMDGGMTWKSVNGAEYLARYRQDPETGKKRFNSLGRRSAETEAAYNDFVEKRDAARQTVEAGRDGLLLAGRVAKAYSLARMPTKTAEIVRSLWRRSADDQIALFGGSALYAYELESKILAPKDLALEDRLSFVFAGSAEYIKLDDVLDAIEDATDERARVIEQRERMLIRFGTLDVEFFNPAYLTGLAADRDQSEALADAFKMPTVKGISVARDAQPVEITALDPRTYAVAAHMLGRDDQIWAERAEFAATLVRERWPEPFDDRQESVFADAEADGPRAPFGP